MNAAGGTENHSLAISPKRSLVKHIGLDLDATYSHEGDGFFADSVADITIDYVWDDIATDAGASDYVVQSFADEKRRRKCVRRRVAGAFNRLAGIHEHNPEWKL